MILSKSKDLGAVIPRTGSTLFFSSEFYSLDSVFLIFHAWRLNPQ